MIDLRSDTVTLPTEEMREAMRRAELGDDSREGDPTVRRLEEAAAAITGKEAALFVASGTMSNLVALLAHTGRGGEVLLDGDSHIMRSEMGGIASLAGLFYRADPVDARRARSRRDRRAPDARGSAPTSSRPRWSASRPRTTAPAAPRIPLDYMAKLRALTAEKSVPVHIDGARIFNAAVALGVPAAEIARHGDSIGFCVSKGLSAPFGSVLCGSAAFIERARAYRRMVGGGMRQAGVMAAAGIVALERMIDRLADDHRARKRLAEGLHAIDPRLSDPRAGRDQHRDGRDRPHRRRCEDLDRGAGAAGRAARGAWSRTSIRLVTHRHIDDAAVDQAIGIVRAVHRRVGKGAAADPRRDAPDIVRAVPAFAALRRGKPTPKPEGRRRVGKGATGQLQTRTCRSRALPTLRLTPRKSSAGRSRAAGCS